MAATSMAFERELSFMLENTPVQKSARNESRSRRLRAGADKPAQQSGRRWLLSDPLG
jgi:hypothetical protein